MPPNRIDGTIRMKGPLSYSEIFPNAGGESATSTSNVAANNPFAFADVHTANYAPQQQLVLPTSFYAQYDYRDLNSIIAELKTRFGNNLRGQISYMNGTARISLPLRTKINAFVNTPYQYMYSGNYGVRFRYASPTTTEHSGLTSIYPIVKTFNYPLTYTAVFLLRTN
jgi:hypothetical protein